MLVTVPRAGDLEAEALAEEEIRRLTADPTPANRAFSAAQAAAALDVPQLSTAQRARALELVRRFAQDAETTVRAALAERVKSSALLPREVAFALANDIESVALPVIQHADCLTDADLVAVIRSGSPARQTAVARRARLSGAVSGVLCAEGAEPAVATLAGNHGAEIADESLEQALDRFPRSAGLHGAMIARLHLPVAVIEKLFALAADSLRRALLARGDIPEDMVARLVLRARESATVENLSIDADTEQVETLVESLHTEGRLTPALVVRALLGGDLRLFVKGMAQRAGVTASTVKILMQDAGPLGLRALHRKAELPDSYFPLLRAAVDVVLEFQRRGDPPDRSTLARAIGMRIAERADGMSGAALRLIQEPWQARAAS